ncbi:MAG TPA: hypothetical protein VKU02_15780 [Gemmataceae bacterium]|nr:hypothetical protein [Gemmataceae bacterium]
MKQLLCGFVSLSLVLALSGEAQAQPAYTYSTLDVPGYYITLAASVNDAGQIVGYSSTFLAPSNRHGFLYSGGTYTTIDVPGAVDTLANGINASGQIVGRYDGGLFGAIHGFLLSGGSSRRSTYPV